MKSITICDRDSTPLALLDKDNPNIVRLTVFEEVGEETREQIENVFYVTPREKTGDNYSVIADAYKKNGYKIIDSFTKKEI